MSEMIERVARALHAEATKDSVGGAHVGQFDFPDGRGKSACLDGDFDLRAFARAAIEAMREPTPEALEASRKVFNRVTSENPYWVPSDMQIWQAMIDAALSDPIPHIGA